MCGRYILVQKLEKIAKRFELDIPDEIDYKPSYNISPGKSALVILNDGQMRMEMMRFGMQPFWAKKSMLLINARAEGNRNQENQMHYRGAKDIINKPAFRKPIRSQRCLIIADAFVEGTTDDGLSKPYLVFLKNKNRPFAFAGIYDEWTDIKTGQSQRGFAIITTGPNELMTKIPHHRSPVILKPFQEKHWLNPASPLTDITAILSSYESDKMDAFPITPKIKSIHEDSPELIKPLGGNLNADAVVNVKDEFKRQGFGRRNRHF